MISTVHVPEKDDKIYYVGVKNDTNSNANWAAVQKIHRTR